MLNTIDVTSKDFKSEVLDSELPVLVDFWAPWCQPCLMMSPVLDELSQDLAGKLKVCKVNTELPENAQLAADYQIHSIPNMKVFKAGKVIHEFVGLRPKQMLVSELEPML